MPWQRACWPGPAPFRGNRGPVEEALTGTAVKDEAHPVELYHVVRSFDPCLVCTVHAVDLRKGAGPCRSI